LLVSDVIAVLDELNIAKAHFWGYSMGGRTGFALSKYSSDRCTSLIIGGAHPFPLSKEQFDTRITELQNGGLESLVDHHLGATAPSAWKARLMANDFDALVASWKGRLSGPGFEDVLPDMMMPCLIYAGEADTAYPGIKKCTESMPHVTFLSLPGLNHAGAFAESTRVLPQITSFVRSIPR
jgi:pimeloyl-ACP methyl ester carboxylesterase